MRNLARTTTFITGGASGIDLGTAGALRPAATNAVVADIRQDHLNAVPTSPEKEQCQRKFARSFFDPAKQAEYTARSNR